MADASGTVTPSSQAAAQTQTQIAPKVITPTISKGAVTVDGVTYHGGSVIPGTGMTSSQYIAHQSSSGSTQPGNFTGVVQETGTTPSGQTVLIKSTQFQPGSAPKIIGLSGLVGSATTSPTGQITYYAPQPIQAPAPQLAPETPQQQTTAQMQQKFSDTLSNFGVIDSGAITHSMAVATDASPRDVVIAPSKVFDFALSQAQKAGAYVGEKAFNVLASVGAAGTLEPTTAFDNRGQRRVGNFPRYKYAPKYAYPDVVLKQTEFTSKTEAMESGRQNARQFGGTVAMFGVGSLPYLNPITGVPLALSQVYTGISEGVSTKVPDAKSLYISKNQGYSELQVRDYNQQVDKYVQSVQLQKNLQFVKAAGAGLYLAGEGVRLYQYATEPIALKVRNPYTGRQATTIQPKSYPIVGQDTLVPIQTQEDMLQATKSAVVMVKPAAYQIQTTRWDEFLRDISGGTFGKFPVYKEVTSPKTYLLSSSEGMGGIMLMKPTTSSEGQYAQYSIKPGQVFRERIDIKSSYREYGLVGGEQVKETPESLNLKTGYESKLAGNYFMKDETQAVSGYSGFKPQGRITVKGNEIKVTIPEQPAEMTRFQSVSYTEPFASDEQFTYPISMTRIREINSVSPSTSGSVQPMITYSSISKEPFTVGTGAEEFKVVTSVAPKGIKNIITEATASSKFNLPEVKPLVSEAVTSFDSSFNLPRIVTGETTSGQSIFANAGQITEESQMFRVSLPVNLIPKTSVSAPSSSSISTSFLIPTVSLATISPMIQPVIQKPIQPTANIFKEAVIQKPEDKGGSKGVTISKTIQLQTPIEIQVPIEVTTQTQIQTPSKIQPFEDLKLVSPIDEEFKLLRKKKPVPTGNAFKTFVIKGGQKRYLPGVALKSEAISKGEKIASNTLVATFGVERTEQRLPGIDAGYTPSTLKFRGYRISGTSRIGLKDTWIQKSSTMKEGISTRGGRLASIGERREIQSLRLKGTNRRIF